MGFFKGGTKKKDGEPAEDDWHKRATLFKKGARLGAKPRTIAFHHDADVVPRRRGRHMPRRASDAVGRNRHCKH